MLSAFAMNYLLLAQEVGLSLPLKILLVSFRTCFTGYVAMVIFCLPAKDCSHIRHKNLIIPFAENLKDSNVSSDQLSEPLLFILCCWIFAKIRLNIM